MAFDMVCFSVVLWQQIPQIYSPLDYFISLNQFYANFIESPFALRLQNSLSLEAHHFYLSNPHPIFTATY